MGKRNTDKASAFRKQNRGGNKAILMQHKRKAQDDEEVHVSDLDEDDYEFAERMSTLASMKE